jgi:putative transposase
VSVAAFIASQRTGHDVPHAVACRALAVSQSWCYKWRDRPVTPRQDRRARLAVAVRQVFDDSGGTYGSPRIGDELPEQGWQVSDTIAQLMVVLGLVARARRRRRGLTRPGKRPAAPDLIKRKFTAPAPDVAWCGDMTEIVTQEGKALPRDRHRPVLQAHPRLCHGCPSRRRPGRRRVEHGRRHPRWSGRWSDLPQRQGQHGRVPA